MVDSTRNAGWKGQRSVFQGETGTKISVVTTQNSSPHDHQNRILEGKESYHHAGVHIHSKTIAADPFGDDPICPDRLGKLLR